MYFKTSLILLNIALVAHAAPKSRLSKAECSEEQLDKSDACFKRVLLLGDTSQNVPMTPDQMDQHCDMAMKSVTCFRNYQKCLKRMPRQIYSMLANNVNKFAKKKCSDKGKQGEQ